MILNPNYVLPDETVGHIKEALGHYKNIRENSPEFMHELKARIEQIQPGLSGQLDKVSHLFGGGHNTNLGAKIGEALDGFNKATSIEQLIPQNAQGVLGFIPGEHLQAANSSLKRMQAYGKAARVAHKWFSMPEWKRSLYGGAIFGGGGALVTSMFDKQDDDMLSVAKKVVIGTGVEIATDKLMEWGIHKFAVHKGEQYISKITAGKITLSEVEDSLGIHVRPHALLTRSNKIGAIVGAAAGLVIGDHTGLFNTVTDVASYGAAGFGIGVLLDQYREYKPSTPVPKKDITPGDINKAEVEVNATKLPLDEELETKKAVTRFRTGAKVVGVVGAALFAAGTVADISNRMAAERRVERQKADQEKQLQRKQSQEDRRIRSMFGYQYVDMGEIVTQMWDNRIGHYKMGNAKFQ